MMDKNQAISMNTSVREKLEGTDDPRKIGKDLIRKRRVVRYL